MTTSRVGNVSKVMPVSTNGNSKGTSVDATGFQKVWNSRTDRDNYSQITNSNSKSGKNQQSGVSKNSLHNKKIQQTGSATSNQKTEESGATDAQRTQQMLELLQMITQQLLQQLSDTLNVPVQEMQQVMDELGMSSMDLLNQDNLSQLLLHMNGVEDSMTLLTDEQLYQQYQDAMQLRENAADALTDAPWFDENAMQKAETVLYGQTQALRQPDASMQEAKNAEVLENITNGVNVSPLQSEAQEKLTEMSREDTGSRQSGEHNKSDEPVTSNLVLQSMKESAFTQQTEQIAEQSAVQEPDTQDIMRQIMDYMKVQVKPGMSSLEMQLHPANLGMLQIQVASKGGVLTAQFVTQNESVKAALESQMVQLKENFDQQGIQVEAIEVTVQTHQFEQNLEQGRGRQQEQSSQAPRVRRALRLDTLSEMDYTEDMDAEDQLTMEMMEANGTTVDFTA